MWIIKNYLIRNNKFLKILKITFHLNKIYYQIKIIVKNKLKNFLPIIRNRRFQIKNKKILILVLINLKYLNRIHLINKKGIIKSKNTKYLNQWHLLRINNFLSVTF